MNIQSYLTAFADGQALLLDVWSLLFSLNGQFAPKLQLTIFPRASSAIYASRLLWCELLSFGNKCQDIVIDNPKTLL